MLSNNELMDLHKSNEEILERISSGLENLKEQSICTNAELCKQTEQLNLIGDHIEHANESITVATEDIAEISKKTSGKITAAVAVGHTAAIVGAAVVAPIIGPLVISVPFVAYYIYRLSK